MRILIAALVTFFKLNIVALCEINFHKVTSDNNTRKQWEKESMVKIKIQVEK